MGNWIIIITGLPRSGTTLMMRMLEAGGIEPYYDTSRPVEFIENGVNYINHNVILRETDKINDLKTGDGDWLSECYGKAVKILTSPKVIIPEGHSYKFIWMDRKIKHMVNSQNKYAIKSDKLNPMAEDKLTHNVKHERIRGIKMLKAYPDSLFIRIRFEDAIKNPKSVVVRIARFLNIKLDIDKMIDVVVPRPVYCLPDMMEERIYNN